MHQARRLAIIVVVLVLVFCYSIYLWKNFRGASIRNSSSSTTLDLSSALPPPISDHNPVTSVGISSSSSTMLLSRGISGMSRPELRQLFLALQASSMNENGDSRRTKSSLLRRAVPLPHPGFRLPVESVDFRGLSPTAQAELSRVNSMHQLQLTIRSIALSKKEEKTLSSKDPPGIMSLLETLYEIEAKPARVKIPSSFAAKAKAMFASFPGLSGTTTAANGGGGGGGGGGESKNELNFLENQVIITTYNRFTDEYSLFNEIRRYRPGYSERLSSENEEVFKRMIEDGSGADKCDFCHMERTAEDVAGIGRIFSKHSYTAANVAKYEQWHSLVVGRNHNPLQFDSDILADYLQTTHKWFDAVHVVDREAIFPHLMWDVGPRSSASQMHTHMQVALTHDRYFSRAEQIRRSMANYERRFVGRGFWQDVIAVHEQLGLAVRHGTSVALSHLCPIKEREILIITENGRSASFAELIADSLSAMKDDVGTRAFSMAIIFHPVGDLAALNLTKSLGYFKHYAASSSSSFPNGFVSSDQQQHSNPQSTIDDTRSLLELEQRVDELLYRRMLASYPTVARIVDRGNPLDRRSDVGAMEFFGANNVGADPFHIMPFLRKRVLRRQDDQKK